MRLAARGILRLAALLAPLVLGACILLQDSAGFQQEQPRPTPHGRAVTRSLAEMPALSDHIVMFNRVPKSGGETYVLMLQKLQGTRFRHVRLGGGRPKRMDREQRRKFTKEVAEVIREQAIPLSFDKIVHFTNFTEFGIQSPIYFNVIRDPLKNAISRMASLSLKRTSTEVSRESKRASAENFAECWLAGIPECSLIDEVPFDFAIPYFCGHREECMKLNSIDALNLAKDNVERYYPIVGILEYPNETLSMLENKLPLFFKGANDLYSSKISEKQKRWNSRSEINSIPNDQLKSILHTEYDFYNWAKMRLLSQASSFVPKTDKSSMHSEKYHHNYLTER